MPAAAVPILDGHNDVLLELELAERRGAPWSFVQGRPDGHVDLPRARAGGWAGGFFACFVPERLDGGDSLASQRCVADDGSWEVPPDPPVDLAHARDVALAMAGRLLRLAGDSGGAVRVVRAAAEIESCLADGAIAAI